jgi:hypothetical protein
LEIDRVLKPLRAGYAHLDQASRTLPGFELVRFEQGCCGLKAAKRSAVPR